MWMVYLFVYLHNVIWISLCAKVLCACMYMCSCVIVCHPSPLQSAYHLAKTEVLSEQLQTLGLQQDKVRCVYVGEGDRRETVVSCVPPSLHVYLLFFSCYRLCFLYLLTHVLHCEDIIGRGGDRWG